MGALRDVFQNIQLELGWKEVSWMSNIRRLDRGKQLLQLFRSRF